MLLNLGLDRIERTLQPPGSSIVAPVLDLAAPLVLMTLWRYFLVFLARARGTFTSGWHPSLYGS